MALAVAEVEETAAGAAEMPFRGSVHNRRKILNMPG